MAKRNLSVLAIAAVLVAVPISAHSQEQNFVLVNGTGLNIVEVYLSPHSDPNWRWNRLTGVLADGESRGFDFHGFSSCLWDLKLVLSDGGIWSDTRGIDLCKTYAVGVGEDGDLYTIEAR